MNLCPEHLQHSKIAKNHDELIPLRDRIEKIGEDADLQEVSNLEKQLLYVASTRARDHLLVTYVDPAPALPDDLTH